MTGSKSPATAWRPQITATALLAIAASIGLPSTGSAESVADFYKGKTVEIVVGSNVGGGYDNNARLIAKYFSHYLPGSPKFVVKNQPGGGGLIAPNNLYNIAPRDGTVLGAIPRGMITMQFMGTENVRWNSAHFVWIGSTSNETSVCVAWHTAAVKSWDDLFSKHFIVGGVGTGTGYTSYPTLLKKMFGANIRVINGYPGGSQATMAMERNEVDGVCPSYTSFRTLRSDWFEHKKVSVIANVSLDRIADYPDMPSILERAQTEEQRQIVKLVLAQNTAGRPLMGPPEIPVDRVGALRAAFEKTVADPAFIADAEKVGLTIEAVSGDKIEALVNDMAKTPPAVIAKMQEMIAQD